MKLYEIEKTRTNNFAVDVMEVIIDVWQKAESKLAEYKGNRFAVYHSDMCGLPTQLNTLIEGSKCYVIFVRQDNVILDVNGDNNSIINSICVEYIDGDSMHTHIGCLGVDNIDCYCSIEYDQAHENIASKFDVWCEDIIVNM